MTTFELLMQGFETALTPINLLYAVIGVVLAVGSFYAFYSGLGIPLPAGILDGIL